jgi:hypothetical protein
MSMNICPTCSGAQPLPAAGQPHVAFILDRSGSMNSCRDQAINGFNEYLGNLKRDSPEVLFALTLFWTEVAGDLTERAVCNVPELTAATYRPDGMTALYDAIGRTVRGIERTISPADSVVVVIFTDGRENASQEYSRESVFALIDQKQKAGNWTFVYLGANQDAWSNASGLGIPVGNAMNYDTGQTHGTMTAAYRGTRKRLLRAAVGQGASTETFWGDAGMDNLSTPGPETKKEK